MTRSEFIAEGLSRTGMDDGPAEHGEPIYADAFGEAFDTGCDLDTAVLLVGLAELIRRGS